MAIRGSGALPASEINNELGLTTNAQISIGGAVPRVLAGVASGVIRQAADYYGKSNRKGSVVTWPASLAGGSTTTAVSVGAPTSQFGSALNAGQSMSFNFNVTGYLSPRVLYTGTYLYTYLAVSTYTLNADGTANVPWSIYYPYWGSSQAGSTVYITGINGSDTPNAIAWDFYKTCVGNRAAMANDIGIRISTSVNGGNDGAGYYTSFPTSSTITLRNTSSTNYWIGSFLGANGHYTPLYWGYYNTSNQWSVYQGNIDVTGITAFGLPLVQTLTINGTAVRYVASNGATQASVIAGFKSAINAAGISGVSAVDVSDGLGIIGATSVSQTDNQTTGSSNYTPTIGLYGAF
jgi:hypothetical protein